MEIFDKGKRGSKGKEIEYSSLEMADYLLPYSQKLKLLKNRKYFQSVIAWLKFNIIIEIQKKFVFVGIRKICPTFTPVKN